MPLPVCTFMNSCAGLLRIEVGELVGMYRRLSQVGKASSAKTTNMVMREESVKKWTDATKPIGRG